jgi:hypothetical protein
MNNKLIILALSLVVQTAFSDIAYSAAVPSNLKAAGSADANITDRYALPPSKVNIAPCQREALHLHPGTIEKQRMLHRNGDFLVRFQIQGNDGLEWFMLCDLSTGKIIEAF